MGPFGTGPVRDFGKVNIRKHNVQSLPLSDGPIIWQTGVDSHNTPQEPYEKGVEGSLGAILHTRPNMQVRPVFTSATISNLRTSTYVPRRTAVSAPRRGSAPQRPTLGDCA